MSHKEEHIVCPNCGFMASENYCARCGQETHLHKETFGGLIMHFAGHYFHYDSKFWKTMKALWTKPGLLTTAYWSKQRMRYIPPISLYIFISVVFFLVYNAMPVRRSTVSVITDGKAQPTLTISAGDAEDHKEAGGSVLHTSEEKAEEAGKEDSAKLPVETDDKEKTKEQAKHMLPKIFFFLIPMMGLILLLLFYRRKELTYVQHTIFALHYHTFWFTIMLLYILYRFKEGNSIALLIAFLISSVYFIVALKRVYSIGWIRSVLYSAVVAFSYLIFLFFSFAGIIGVLALEHYLKR